MSTFIIAAVFGVVVGILSGLLGIGGGTVMVPIFRLGFGLSAIQATATSLFTIIPTSIAGCVTHIRNKTCNVPLGLASGLGGALTSPLGVWLAHLSPGWAIMTATACIIGYSAINMLVKAVKSPREIALELGASQVLSPQMKLTRAQLGKGAIIGLAAGVASGYVGVGGGFIMVPLFISAIGITMKHASGTSLLAVTLLAIPGAIEQAILGNINFVAGIALAVGTIPGAMLGAHFVRRVPERALRFLFGGFLVVVAIILAINEFSSLAL